jgi:8-oxo-dGTP diphosphatase
MEEIWEVTEDVLCKVVITCGSKALLVKRSKWVHYSRGRWDLFGGAMDEGETKLKAAVRECKEEGGLEIEEDSLSLISQRVGERSGHRALRVCFKLSVAEEFEPKLSFEHSEFKWMSKEEILETDLPDFYKDCCGQALQN